MGALDTWDRRSAEVTQPCCAVVVLLEEEEKEGEEEEEGDVAQSNFMACKMPQCLSVMAALETS